MINKDLKKFNLEKVASISHFFINNTIDEFAKNGNQKITGIDMSAMRITAKYGTNAVYKNFVRQVAGNALATRKATDENTPRTATKFADEDEWGIKETKKGVRFFYEN